VQKGLNLMAQLWLWGGRSIFDFMKRSVDTNSDLLADLALRGDAQAFFSLCADYFKARYLRERDNGATHQDAQMRIIADATELLEELGHVTPGRFDAWFEERCTMLPDASQDEKEIVVFDRKMAVETSAFLSRCRNELQRRASEIKRARLERERRFPAMFLRHKPLLAGLTVAALLGLGGVLGALVLSRLGASIVLTLVTSSGERSLRFPAHKDKACEAAPQVQTQAPEPIKSDTVLTEQGRGDTVPAKPATAGRKVYAPRSSTPQAEKRASPPLTPRAYVPPPPPSPPPPSPSEAAEHFQSETPVAAEPALPPAEQPQPLPDETAPLQESMPAY